MSVQNEPVVSGASAPSLTASAILSKAADLIKPKGRWTQRQYARREVGGRSVSPVGDLAVCYCAIGAMAAASGIKVNRIENGKLGLMRYLQGAIGQPSVIGWNDRPERTQAQVVAALRKAAKLALAEEAGDGVSRDATKANSGMNP